MPIDGDKSKRGLLIIEFNVEFPNYVETDKKEVLKKTLRAH